jgi:predicted component of type VI protein secretion system
MTGEEKPESFQEALYDQLARMAIEELGSDTEERDEVQLSVPVTLRPVENAASPEENCVEISITVLSYHRTFKGKYPGPDKYYG